MVAHLLLILAVQQPQVAATVNRSELAVGDTLVLNVTATTVGSGWLQLTDPTLQGLEIYRKGQVSSVQVVGGEERRETVRTFYLRATIPGRAIIGPARLQHGVRSVRTREINVTVTGSAGPSDTALPFLRSLLATSRPPSGRDDVTVTIELSSDSLVIGEQLDMVVVAWFPRRLRARLRNPPTLEPPRVSGAWIYQSTSPTGVISSREVDGDWYDLHIHHQTVFPLSTEGFEIGRATINYNMPLTFSFLSRELRHVVLSEVPDVKLVPPPPAGRPEDFEGAAGRDITFELDVSDTELVVGEAATVAATIEGFGNVALWPEPNINWPHGLRVYPLDVSFTVAPVAGVIGGSKQFTYLVVPDSAGTHRIEPRAYGYFELQEHRYNQARARSIELTTPQGRTVTASRSDPPSLMSEGRRPVAELLLATAPTWIWVILSVMAPMVALLARYEWRRTEMVRRTKRHQRNPLDDAGVRFRRLLETLVPEAAHREGMPLEEALRAAGLEDSLAAHAARLRDRLTNAVYGPDGASDSDELVAEVEEVLGVLTKAGRSAGRSGGVILLWLLVIAPAVASAQVRGPETLYDARASVEAADSFASRAGAEPRVAAHWFNLGNARYMNGEAQRARLSWIRAARLSPRTTTIRRALSLTDPDRVTARTMWISPITPFEAFTISLASWIVAWLLLGLRVRRRRTALLLTLSVIGAGYGVFVSYSYERPIAVVITNQTPFRGAPYGTAEASGFLNSGMAVRVTDARGAWLLVSRGRQKGWLLATEVERL